MIETILKNSIERIRSEQLHNEAQVKQAVIVPILRSLGWDDSNPAEFVPEHSMSHSASGRVDYALLRPDGTPGVFIEAKKLGAADGAGESQLFQYAYGQGVPFLILTDGEIWNFYLSMAEGVPAERRFYRAVLTAEGKTAEYARNFERYIGKTAVCSGDARKTAEEQHTSNRSKENANRTIPKVWRALLENPDPELRGLLATAVENECGTRPEIDDLDKFLEGQLHPITQTTSTTRQKTKTSSFSSKTTTNKKIIGYIFMNKEHEVGIGNRTLAEILKEFHHRDPTFMAKFAAKTMGRTRRLVAQSRENLYDQQDLAEYSVDLENGWWLGTNISSRDVRKNCQIACDVAGVKFGSQLTLIERGVNA